MKRHKQLQPLSKQHHNGLLAVLLLKKGIAKKADEKIMSAFILDFWKSDLDAHFENEEKVLLPALMSRSFNNDLSIQLLQEHTLLHSYITLLQREPSLSMINSFAQLLEQHIRFEERIYFPAAEKELNEEQLRQIGEQLQDNEEINCMNYPVKFWE